MQPIVVGYSIKLILNFKRKDGLGQNVLHVMTYPVKLQPTVIPLDPNYLNTGQDFATQQATNTCLPSYFTQSAQSDIQSVCSAAYYTNNRLYARSIYTTTDTTTKKTLGDLLVMPNPGNDFIKIVKPTMDVQLLSVMNSDGKIVYTFSCNSLLQTTIDTHSWAVGIYLATYIKDGKRVSKKIMIAR